MKIDEIIDGIIKREGGYCNNKNDSGGETCYGITVAVARAAGYTGPMASLPLETAKAIYLKQFYTDPGFNLIVPIAPDVAEELIDTGVNMGPEVAVRFFQRCLNAFNDQQRLYPDIPVDGRIGQQTAKTFQTFLAGRGAKGKTVMLKALNCLQGERYISLCEKREKDEDFVFGWFDNRVSLPA